MSPSGVLGFAVVSIAVIAVPGPSVLFAVSRALIGGRRYALLTVLGNAAGLFAQVLVVALGLGAIVAGSGIVESLLGVAGAVYLAWLGMAAMRRPAQVAENLGGLPAAPSTAPLRDGFLIGATNPKSLLFLAALLPQHVARTMGPAVLQMVALGGLFCLIALVSDGAWAVAAARARDSLSRHPRRLRLASAVGGAVMIGLALLLLAGGLERLQ